MVSRLNARHSRNTVELHEPFQKPIEMGAALALSIWFVAPWLSDLLSLGLF